MYGDFFSSRKIRLTQIITEQCVRMGRVPLLYFSREDLSLFFICVIYNSHKPSGFI